MQVRALLDGAKVPLIPLKIKIKIKIFVSGEHMVLQVLHPSIPVRIHFPCLQESHLV